LEELMDLSIQDPIYEAEDYQGVRDKMSRIQDPQIIQKFLQVIKNRQIIIADGHHRYEGSLSYLKKQKEANPNHTGKEAYNFHMMYLTNMESDNLRILPTHRLIQNFSNFDPKEILKKLAHYFTIKKVENAFEINEVILGKAKTFGLLFEDTAYKITLKAEVFSEITWQLPTELKQLDQTIVHFFIIEKVLGIQRKDQRSSKHIGFDRSFTDCLTKVMNGEVQMAVITKDVSIDDVKKVCFSGHVMPQKSTYFYPKVICGFLFNSISEKKK